MTGLIVLQILLLLLLFILYSYILQFLITSALYVASVFNRPLPSSFLFCMYVIHIIFWVILLLLLLLLLLCVCCLLSHTFSPHYLSSPTNSYPHRSEIKFHTAAFSILCVMFQVELPTVLSLLMFSCTVFVFWSFLALPVVGQTAVVSARKLKLNELIWSWIILISLLTNSSKSLYSYIIYSPVYSQLSFHSINWTEQNSTLHVLRKTIVTQMSTFTVITLFVLFFLMCLMFLPAFCVFQFVACICYSFCPMLLCQHTQTVNSWTELNYLHLHCVQNHLHRYRLCQHQTVCCTSHIHIITYT